MTSGTLRNRCFDEIHLGDSARITHTLTLRDVQLFAAVSGDISPTQRDSELATQFTFMRHADGAGIVLGARVPTILTSRADNERTKFASCAVACLMANAAAGQAPKKTGA